MTKTIKITLQNITGNIFFEFRDFYAFDFFAFNLFACTYFRKFAISKYFNSI